MVLRAVGLAGGGLLFTIDHVYSEITIVARKMMAMVVTNDLVCQHIVTPGWNSLRLLTNNIPIPYRIMNAHDAK
jgi:hypothetical protein